MNTGAITPDEAINLIGSGGISFILTPQQQDEIKTAADKFKADTLAALDTAFTEGDPTQVDVPVDANVVPAVDGEQTKTDVTTAIDQAVNDGTPAQVKTPVNVTPSDVTFDTTQLQTQQDVTDLTLSLDGASTSFDALKTHANDAVTQIVMQLGLLNLTFIPFSFFMNSGLESIKEKLSAIITGVFSLAGTMLVEAPVILVLTGALQTGFQTLADAAVTALDTVGSKIDDIAGKLGGILNTIASINSAQVNPTIGGGGGPQPTGRASGGDVNANQLYQVLERGLPELFTRGGKYYFLSPQAGRIIPLDLTSVPKAQPQNVYNTSSPSIQYNPSVVIQVTGSGDMTQLAQQVADKVAAANASQKVDLQRLILLHGGRGA